MAKKRKAGSHNTGRDRHQKPIGENGKLSINTYEDVADSEDEFHVNRDKILLEEGPAQKRQRRLQEEEEFLELSDEEVLADSEEPSDSEDDVEDTLVKNAAKASGSKFRALGKPIQDSDSEASASADEYDDAGGWGASKQDYYNADVIETEADALEEEAEARRLQQKQLEGMTEADFGLDEIEWATAGKDDEGTGQTPGGVVREVLPKLEIKDSMGIEERLEILRMRYPEFEPLAKELLGLQSIHGELGVAAQKARETQAHRKSDLAKTEDALPSMAVVKHSALSAYLAALCMYFALLTSGAPNDNGKVTAMAPEKLRDHAIMETLVQCRDLWQKVKHIEVPEPVPSITDAHGLQSIDEPLHGDKKSQAEPQESEKAPKKHKKRKSKAEKAAEAAQAEANAHREQRLRETEADLANLSTLTAPPKAILNQPSKPTTTAPAAETDPDSSDIGEATSLTAHEAAEKAKRRKSLRFYTSQIAQKSNKRGAAGRDAGGDADLPYRERFKDKQARLNAEAEKRGKKPHNERDALGGESDDEDRAVANEMRAGQGGGDGDGSEDYYDLVSSRAAQKKAAKAALAAANAQAEREGGIVRVVDEEMADGKRAITYAIEKNKGLAPKRSALVRNPRVKKRKKYEDKKKKLSSVRAVYKGGEGRGGYGGEKTGIKKGLVKSIKL